MSEVNARILYWGIGGAGKLSNLKTIHAKLRPDHRGEIEALPTRIDPSVSYHSLPIELGEVGGVGTHIRVETTVASPEHAPTRRQLLDRVDGMVFVADTQRDQIDANLASWAELREMLAEYGREISDVPLVVQYNKRDLSDPFALEELHRKLELSGVAVFEAVATEGTGVLQTLTTISKRVVRTLREREPGALADVPDAPVTEDPLADSSPQLDPLPTEGLDAELLSPDGEETVDLEMIEATTSLAESTFEESFREATENATAEALGTATADAERGIHLEDSLGVGLDIDGPDEARAETPSAGRFEIAQVGTARADGPRAVAVPIVVRDERGEQRSLLLTVRLDPQEEA